MSDNIDWDAVYAGKILPPAYCGPLSVQQIEGKGRGVVAAAPIAAGDLLLVCEPVVFMEAGAEEGMPAVDQLVDKMGTGLFTEQQLAWIACLHAGDETHLSRALPPLGAPSDPQASKRLMREEDCEEALRINVLALNMFGEEAQDLPASTARGDTPAAHLGLWPEFSLLNHSCAPNAMNYTIRDRMVVRAAMDIAQGEEVSINYLGRASLRPASERLMDLRDGYSFACACPRCAVEMEPQFEAAVGAVQLVHDAVMCDLVPGLQAALAPGDDKAPPAAEEALALTAQARAKLQPLLSSLDLQLAQLQEAGPSGPGARPNVSGARLVEWFKASAYEAYALQAQLASVDAQLQSGAPPDAQHTAAFERAMLGVASSIAPCSNLHLFLAVKQWQAAVQAGSGGVAASEAKAKVMEVLRFRYGAQLQDQTLETLMEASVAALDQVAL